MMDSMQRLLGIRDAVVAAIAPLGSEDVELDGALGRYLAAPALARVPCPPATCSAMDGYAVRASDVPGPTRALAPAFAPRIAGRRSMEDIMP